MKLENFINTLKTPKSFIKAILWRCIFIIRILKYREKKLKYGDENPELKFYIIGFEPCWNGLAWINLHILEHIEYAENKKFIPVIDLQNFKTQYVSAEETGKQNVWEYWFEQPAGYDLQAVSKSKNIVKSRNIEYPNEKYRIGYYEYKNEKYIQNLRNIYKKNIKINGEMFNKILQIHEEIVGNKKILGIMCRGTDFSTLKPAHHPIQPNPLDIINEAEIIMRKHNCTHIFLSTEDKEIYDLFKHKFPDCLLSVSQNRFSASDLGGKKSLSELSDAKNRREIAFSYLASMSILSKSSCFICGITGGSILVKIMSDGFEYEHFWDLGLYQYCNSLSEMCRDFCSELNKLLK
jgi:hypothetical protein